MEMYSWRVYDGSITLPCQLPLTASHPVLKPMGERFRLIISYVHLITISMPARSWRDVEKKWLLSCELADAKHSLLIVPGNQSQRLQLIRCRFTKIRETKRGNVWKPIYTIIKQCREQLPNLFSQKAQIGSSHQVGAWGASPKQPQQ